MLKALELAGFKSFAEKTRFEFPRGITVVVGPNGSGKSNVVDAIKWALGEQSVKSLRSKEMIDVIFNGAANRRPLNSAEVTLTFDNADRRFPIDTPEVQVTRRVYRSGEAEYLLNRQACRLMDIRELCRGTGVATEAYSVIEQGKVDVLLQSSPRDRRLIFEEAAGISRFKTKKIESLRRLERVEQNLLRLSDIVDEVESRLKSVRLQAAKAQRYKEVADRLQELRTQVGRADWRKLGQKLGEFEAEAAALQEEISSAATQAEAMDGQILEHDLEINEVDESLRSHESHLHQNRQRIAVLESSIEHERTRCLEYDEEVQRHRRQAIALSVRAGDLQQLVAATADEYAAAETRRQESSDRLTEVQKNLAELTGEIEALRGESDSRRTAHREQAQTVAAMMGEIAAFETGVSTAEALDARDRQRLAELHSSREFLTGEATQLRQRLSELTSDWEANEAQRQADQRELASARQQLAHEQQELAQWQQLHAGAAERTRVLEEWERRLEGVHAGVKELLVRAQGLTTGPLKAIRGMVADLLRVPVEMAPLIDIALGEKAQHLVINSGFDLQLVIEGESARLSGRVGFLRLDWEPEPTTTPAINLQQQPGILARADEFVEVDPPFQALVSRLLGRTWIVDRLEDATAASEGIGRGQNFVTRKGELLTADGGLVAGPRNASSGLISRRSELRALKQQLVELREKIAERSERTAELAEKVTRGDAELQQTTAAHQQLATALAEQRQQVRAAEERLEQLAQQTDSLAQQVARAAAEQQAAQTALADAQHRWRQAQDELAQRQTRLDQDAAKLQEADRRRQQLARQATSRQVDLAKAEQQLEDLRGRQRQYEQDQQERQSAIAESYQQLAQSVARREHADANILTAEAELADLYLRKESFAAEAIVLQQRREAHRQERANLTQEAQRLRNRIRRLEEKLHKKELAAGEVRHERTGLADRLREDYAIELAALEEETAEADLGARTEIEREIADLRQKLNQIGGVNLDALHELGELEERFAHLAGQLGDLTAAKEALEQIIHKINADSRTLFADTLAAVKGHFQALFRKLFGGGQADIVLEEGVDILESGIEIIARPPGKELRSISLMSGGEKTLTCVALLLAIFRNRPSPFCILDEVDAALDEANIGRFIEVVKEFLTWTQFVIVTHSKKTMTCASTLYGITMQESGVSKRVSVRFEDVSENGEIQIKNPAERENASQDDPQAA
ncbi:MAG TPA: chromosome segregation protein SMC [Pirellulales bacterium]|jgi:chromosome segregation protein|nr:chromosome segregation protein SMC [Pirellulales bacterium]